jgi:hypothetical protein
VTEHDFFFLLGFPVRGDEEMVDDHEVRQPGGEFEITAGSVQVKDHGTDTQSTETTVSVIYDWENVFTGVIHCVGKDVFFTQCVYLCHHGICNEGHVFVFP